MNPEQRLAAIIGALKSVGVSCLVMGGHAVRYYGLSRHTNDFDLTLARDGWDDLAERLGITSVAATALGLSLGKRLGTAFEGVAALWAGIILAFTGVAFAALKFYHIGA